MKRWFLTLYSAFAMAMADRAGAKADRWIARAKRAEQRIKEMER